jgi:hypothetical protein
MARALGWAGATTRVVRPDVQGLGGGAAQGRGEQGHDGPSLWRRPARCCGPIRVVGGWPGLGVRAAAGMGLAVGVAGAVVLVAGRVGAIVSVGLAGGVPVAVELARGVLAGGCSPLVWSLGGSLGCWWPVVWSLGGPVEC